MRFTQRLLNTHNKQFSMQDRCTIIYVMADVRSGSTLLENILSKSPETVSVGELALLKGHILHKGPGIKWNWNCSCGLTVAECPFWNNALKNIDVSAADFNISVQWNYKSNKILTGSFFPFILKNALLQINERKINQSTIAALTAIYKNIFQYTGKRFIIDSSKDPVQAYMLYLNKPADFDVKIIGLTRDLRAIAASKRKWSIANKKQHQKSLGKFISNSLFYKRICTIISGLVKPEDSLTISYEQLATDTQNQLNTIFAKTGMQPYKAPEYMYVEDDHTIAGTPQRFEKKPIVYDNTWKQAYNKKPLLSFIGNLINKI